MMPAFGSSANGTIWTAWLPPAPNMIATLDTFRDTLDGDTDPVSRPVVMEMKWGELRRRAR